MMVSHQNHGSQVCLISFARVYTRHPADRNNSAQPWTTAQLRVSEGGRAGRPKGGSKLSRRSETDLRKLLFQVHAAGLWASFPAWWEKYSAPPVVKTVGCLVPTLLGDAQGTAHSLSDHRPQVSPGHEWSADEQPTCSPLDLYSPGLPSWALRTFGVGYFCRQYLSCVSS